MLTTVNREGRSPIRIQCQCPKHKDRSISPKPIYKIASRRHHSMGRIDISEEGRKRKRQI